MSDSAPPLQVVASHCLLGAPVRYDARDKLLPWTLRVPVVWVRFVPLCPEMAAGLGAPREPMTLQGDPGRPRLLGNETGRDFTAAVERAVEALVARCAAEPPELFLLKARSPSCGVGTTTRGGRPGFDGLFAEAAARAFPDTPRADETTLLNSEGRSRIFERLGARRRLRGLGPEPLPSLEAWLATQGGA